MSIRHLNGGLRNLPCHTGESVDASNESLDASTAGSLQEYQIPAGSCVACGDYFASFSTRTQGRGVPRDQVRQCADERKPNPLADQR